MTAYEASMAKTLLLQKSPTPGCSSIISCSCVWLRTSLASQMQHAQRPSVLPLMGMEASSKPKALHRVLGAHEEAAPNTQGISTVRRVEASSISPSTRTSIRRKIATHLFRFSSVSVKQ